MDVEGRCSDYLTRIVLLLTCEHVIESTGCTIRRAACAALRLMIESEFDSGALGESGNKTDVSGELACVAGFRKFERRVQELCELAASS